VNQLKSCERFFKDHNNLFYIYIIYEKVTRSNFTSQRDEVHKFVHE
jgi:hypothetical protein